MARKPGVTVVGVQRRAQIISKAEELLARGGFQDMTMDAIAEALDVSKSGLYHYFKQKDDLLFAIRCETLNSLIAKQRERMDGDLSHIDQVEEMLRAGLKMVSESPARFRALYELKMKSSSAEREAHITELEREYFHLVVATVQGAIDAGELRMMDPRLVAQMILSIANHAQYWFKPAGRLSHRAVADALWEMLYLGVSGKQRDGTEGTVIVRSAKVEFSNSVNLSAS